MADETPILEPTTDNHETQETHAEKPVETVATETETEPTETAAAEVVAAIDAFLTEPQDVHEAEAKIEAAVEAEVEVEEEAGEEAVPEVEAEVEEVPEVEAKAEAEVAETEVEAEAEAEVEVEEEVQKAEVLDETQHTEQTEEAEAPADSSEHEHSSLLEHAEPEHEEEDDRDAEEEHSHIEEHSVLDDSHLDQSGHEHSEHLQEEGSFSHDEHSHLDHSEADHSFGESADAHSERTGSALSRHEEESHYDYQEHDEHDEHEHDHNEEEHDEHEHEMSLHESEQDHDDYAVEEHDELEANEETVSAHDRLQQALADDDATPTVDTRRESTSSSRSGGSGGSGRRTSMRTEALIQAAARAVVAKINGVEAKGADFDIMSSITESHAPSEGRQSVAHSESRSIRSGAHSSAATHSTSNEEADYEHERDMGDDDDVFSNRSHRTSLGSFEHHSGASHTGSDYDHKKDVTAHSTAGDTDAHDSETEHEEDFEVETGSVSYHEEHRSRSPRMSTMSKGPRISDVTGISRMSQYDPHHRDHDESYQDNDDYIPHTIRGAPRPAFRTPSSVRAIQMSSPSPSVIFGVSPRSAARRRRVGTGEGVDDGQSMGSVATYSSLPNSPSKRGTPTRFKVFQRPEPAPLVLLHATIMPTRWGWSDVLRNFDERMSHSPSKRMSENKEELHVDEVPADLASFEPSAALKRLHNTWCQLQEYSLGADTVTERGVLLPHPQNDYEVLEERLLEALELPVRRRARILECGHYLGPADVDDDDDEDYDYYDDEQDNDDDEDSPNKRHWCTACRSDIRYESLGAERVFRVKVYASNGLMTVGAWDACWREMERVDVEIEPIVADPALQRELNLLRTLQQQEVYRRELELEEEMRAMQQEKEEEELQHELASEHEEHHEHHEQEPEHDEHVDTEHHSTSGSVDQFHHVSPSSTPVSPPLRDSPVEPPATTSTDHAHDHEADYRRRAAEDRLREIYGSTPPHASSRTMSLPPQMESTPAMSATPGTALAMTHHSMHTQHSAYGPSPPSPSAEAYERREERRYRQYSYPGPGQDDRADRGFEYGGPAPAFPPPPTSRHGNYNHGHPQHPYEAASFPELLMAAVKVFLRDRKHVAITVLSVIVIVLATLRTPAADATTAPIINTPAPAQAVVKQPVVEAYQPVAVAITTATVFHTVVEELAASVVAKVDTHVETVVEKMTVKVYETVTEVATETSTETATTTATQAATTATAETIAESIESTVVEEAEEAPEATEVISAEEPQETNEAVKSTDEVVAEAEPTLSAYEVVSVEEPQETVEPEAPSSSVAVELPVESAVVESAPVEDDEAHDESHDEL